MVVLPKMEIRRDRTFWHNGWDTGGCADMKNRLPGERKSFSRQTAAVYPTTVTSPETDARKASRMESVVASSAYSLFTMKNRAMSLQ